MNYLGTLLAKDPATLTPQEAAYLQQNHHTTLWTPDTCGCSIRYSWDISTSNDQREHYFHSVEKKCSEHDGLNKDATHYDHILRENQAKNFIHGHLLNNFPRLTKTVVNEDGTQTVQLANGVQLQWSFTGKDDARQLSVQVKGATLTPTEKARVTTFLATLSKPVSLI